MAEQTATSQSSVLAGDCGLSSVEALAYQRQALNNVLQQAAAAASGKRAKFLVAFSSFLKLLLVLFYVTIFAIR